MKKIIITIAVILISVSTLYIVYGLVGVDTKPELTIWSWDDGEFNALKSYIDRDIMIFAHKNGFELVNNVVNESMMSHEEYLKRLSIAISTGQCDIVLEDLRNLERISTSLLSLKELSNYDKILPSFRFSNYFPLEYTQPSYGVNSWVLEEFNREINSDTSCYDFFELKDEVRKSGRVLQLDQIELREIIDEVILSRDYTNNLEELSYDDLFNDYERILDLIYSGAYDYSELELSKNYIDAFGRREDTRPFYTMYSGFESNLFTHNLRYTRANYFNMFTDIRLYTAANSNWDNLGVGISAFSQHKSESLEILDKILSDDLQEFIYKQGYTSIVGLDALTLKAFNNLLPSFAIEKQSYEYALNGDPRYDFKSVTLQDIEFRDFMFKTVLNSIQHHNRLDSYKFKIMSKDEIMKILIDNGKR